MKDKNLPESVYIVTGHHYLYGAVILKAFYSDAAAREYCYRRFEHSWYDYYIRLPYNIEPYRYECKVKKVYVVYSQVSMDDPKILGVYYDAIDAMKCRTEKKSSYPGVTWMELEVLT